jgi:hypothetical protein
MEFSELKSAQDKQRPGEVLPLTFGLEVELLFGMRRGFEVTHPTHWWLNYRALLQDPHDCGLDEECIAQSEGGFHTPLWQAAKIFARKGGELQVRRNAKTDDDSFDKFNYWSLTTEVSVETPDNSERLAEWSGGVIREDVDRWDWSGLELVSPALPVPELGPIFKPNGLVQVKGYLDFMSKDLPPKVPYIFLAGPDFTGLHLHIGLQPQLESQVEFPVKVLRHLAFMCLFFEDAITLLHHPHRHAYPDSKSRYHATPNRHYIQAAHSDDHVHVCKAGKPFSPEDAFVRIFDMRNEVLEDEYFARLRLSHLMASKNSEDEKIDGLAQYYDLHRTMFVNFENIALAAKGGDKRTIEFRQHHGTKDPKHVEQWIVFCTALVRAAERFALLSSGPWNVPPKLQTKLHALYSHGGKYFPNARLDLAMDEATKWGPYLRQERRTLKQLFDVLGLPASERLYWWTRARAYRKEFREYWCEPGYSHSICDEDCQLSPIRDCVGWEEGELEIPPLHPRDLLALNARRRAYIERQQNLQRGKQANGAKQAKARNREKQQQQQEEEEQEDVPMEIDNDIPSPSFYRRNKFDASSVQVPSCEDDDMESVAMDISDGEESSQSPPGLACDDDVDDTDSEPMEISDGEDTAFARSPVHIRSDTPSSLSKQDIITGAEQQLHAKLVKKL